MNWVSSLKKIEARMWADAQNVADAYRVQVLIPFCRKHELTFVSGMGSYCFHQIHIPEDDYNTYPGQVGDVQDAERKGLKMRQIFAVLDYEITRAQYVGYLVADITEEDLHSNKERKR